MKNYSTLPVNCSTLISEIAQYLSANPTPVDPSHPYKASFWDGKVNELASSIPSLGTTFSSIPLDVDGLGHKRIIKDLPFSSKNLKDLLILPITGCENAVVNFAKPKVGSTPLSGDPENYENYATVDCDLVETVAIGNGLLIPEGAIYQITLDPASVNSTIALIFFNDDISGYFA